MRYLIPVFLCMLFSCSKNNNTTPNTPTPEPPVVPPGVTLGVQKQLFGSTRHRFADILESNNKRLIFAVYNTSNTLDEFYLSDEKDSVYILRPYGNPNQFTRNSVSLAIKPNGDIIFLLSQPNGAGMPDSILTLVNKVNTDFCQVVKREVKNSFWNNYYSSTMKDTRIYATQSGRIVMQGITKFAVSDNDGLSWRETTAIPAGFTRSANNRLSAIGNRNFITTLGSSVIYSDDNFENVIQVIMPLPVYGSRIIQLDDQRLVMPLNMPSRSFYQSTNNGQSWSAMPLFDPADSLSTFNGKYFCFIGGTTMRTRAKYKPCNSFFTIDIDPTKKFSFYPVARPSCTGIPLIDDNIIAYTQRSDKRIYYALETTVGVLPFFGVSRDY
jgi:hypothetical protein